MSTPIPPPIVWGPGYELGIEDIDLQHHYFANLILRLARDFDAHSDAALRLGMLEELNAYARFHFTSEENLMQRAGYPGLAAHRALHHRLLDELSARTTSLFVRDVILTPEEVDGLMANLLISPKPPRCPTRLSDWLVEHKSTVGAEYASEIKRHF